MKKFTKHILIVDDEKNIRKTFGTLLKREGYEVDVAGDGEEALLKSKERGQGYDICFLDVQMPLMGGFEFLEIVRRLYPDMTVVMVSAYGTVSRAVEAIKLGAVDFLEKPFDPEKIKALTEEILFRKEIRPGDSIPDLLRLAELARRRAAYSEARSYLKSALQRDLKRPEPYYWLGELEEMESRPKTAMQLYYMALEASPAFEPAREALKRLGYIPEKKSGESDQVFYE